MQSKILNIAGFFSLFFFVVGAAKNEIRVFHAFFDGASGTFRQRFDVFFPHALPPRSPVSYFERVETRIFKSLELREKILLTAKTDAENFLRLKKIKPKLAVVLVGDDPASSIYVKKKTETCLAHGLDVEDIHIHPSQGFVFLAKTIARLNADPSVHGILVQSPLPKGWDEREIFSQVAPAKDVDGFHPQNAGALFIDASAVLQKGLPPCTPAGVMEILKEANIDPSGKNAVIIGRSTIVGKPMAHMLLAADATVTICHSRSRDLEKICSSADILVAAVGRARMVNKNFVKPGAVVIDVGINRETRDGKSKVVGDVDADSIKGIASFLTPVPNGVGPMTIALLIRNTVRAAQLANA